jgi:hypothetical protein
VFIQPAQQNEAWRTSARTAWHGRETDTVGELFQRFKIAKIWSLQGHK